MFTSDERVRREEAGIERREASEGGVERLGGGDR